MRLWLICLKILIHFEIHVCVVRYQINVLPLIPSAIHQIAHYKDIQKYDFSSVRTISCGAAYLPPQLSQKVAKIFSGSPTGVNEGTVNSSNSTSLT